MREILYRAKRKDNGEWVEGLTLQRGTSVDQQHEKCIFLTPDGYSFPLKVDPETVCQYTGLKDKNGKKIWENDICDRKEKFPEIVTYHDGDWTLDYSYASGKETGYSYCNLGFYAKERGEVEVIGNIFDNPELLEV